MDERLENIARIHKELSHNDSIMVCSCEFGEKWRSIKDEIETARATRTRETTNSSSCGEDSGSTDQVC